MKKNTSAEYIKGMCVWEHEPVVCQHDSVSGVISTLYEEDIFKGVMPISKRSSDR